MTWYEREAIVASSLPSVLKAFGLSTEGDATLLPVGATPNIAILVGTAPDRYVLRCCRRDPREKRLLFLSEFHRHLSSSGIPVARSIPTVGGDFLIRVGQWWWQAYSFLDGTDYDYDNPQHLEEAAYWLAQLHLASSTFEPRQYSAYDCTMEKWWSSPQTHLEASWRYFSKVKRAENQFQWHVERDVFASWCCVIAEWIPLEVLYHLPRVWTHGDYHGGNLLFTDHRLLGVLDLDQADRRPRAYDLAFALLMLARRRRGTYKLRPEAMSRFLHVYEEVAPPLSLQERKAIPAMMIASQLPDWGLLDALARCEGDESITCAVTYWVKVLSEISEQFSLLASWISFILDETRKE